MEKIKKTIGYPKSKRLTTWINGPLKEFNNELIEAQKRVKIDPEEALGILFNLIEIMKKFKNTDLKIKSNEVSVRILKKHVVEISQLNSLDMGHMFYFPQPITFFLQLDKEDLRRKSAEKEAKSIILDKVSKLMYLVSEVRKF